MLDLFLASKNRRLDVSGWLDHWKVERNFAPRTIKTLCGTVTFGRVYLRPRRGQDNGWFPLDSALGITADGFSWRVMEIATRLATRVSYAASRGLMKAMLGWAPSTEAIEALAIGLGSRAAAFVESRGPFEDDGVVLVIEVDGGIHDLQVEHDQERTAYLNARGYRVLRFRNEAVLADVEGVLAAIVLALTP